MNIGIVSKATLGKLVESAYGLFRAHRYHLELKWTKLNYCEPLRILKVLFRTHLSFASLLGFNSGESVAQSKSTHSRKPKLITIESKGTRSRKLKLSTMERGHQMDG